MPSFRPNTKYPFSKILRKNTILTMGTMKTDKCHFFTLVGQIMVFLSIHSRSIFILCFHLLKTDTRDSPSKAELKRLWGEMVLMSVP